MKYEVIAEFTDEAGFHEIGSIVEPLAEKAEELLNYDGGARIRLVEGQEAVVEGATDVAPTDAEVKPEETAVVPEVQAVPASETTTASDVIVPGTKDVEVTSEGIMVDKETGEAVETPSAE